MPVSWHSRLLVRSATAMFSTMVPSTARPVASVSAASSRSKPLLDVGRQELERADVERLGELLDFLGIELHGDVLKDQRRARCDQQHGKRPAKVQVVEPAVKPPAEPSAEEQWRQHCDQHYQPGAVQSHPDDPDQCDRLR